MFPNHLKALRQKSGMNQSQLSEVSGISFKVIQAYECGARNLSGAKLATLLTLCEVLNCRLGQLLADEELVKQIEQYENKKEP